MKKEKIQKETNEASNRQDPARPGLAPDEDPAAREEADAPTLSPEEAEQKEDAQTAKAKENWDRLLRVTADFDNFRKRAAREKEEAIRYANHKLVERLLPVLDSLDMAIAAATTQPGETSESLMEGINLVLQQLKSVLAESGLKEIEAHGKAFDPNLHEAVSQLETDDFEEGHVAHQIRKGYLLRDRLVRPSSVIVAKKPAA